MPFIDVSANVWTAVTTTVEDTAVQNRGGRNMYITTLDTAALPLNEGVVIGPDQALVINAGKDVKVSCIGASGQLFYVGI